jgi:trimeric autotransporter adhesin
MDKKKVFKLATASTVAASAFLVAAPTQAAGFTVAQAEYLVNKAIKAQDSLRKQTTVYNVNDPKLLAGAPVQINRLEKAIANAKAAIGTLSKKHRVVLYAKLDDYTHGPQKLKLAQTLQNGKNFEIAAQKATKVQEAKAAVQANLTEENVTALEKAITEAQAAYNNVYGRYTREAYRSTHGTEVTAWLNAEKEKMTPKVSSVSAINGSQLVVKFNKAVLASDVISAGAPVNVIVTQETVDGVTATNPGTLTAELSEDGKSLTLTSAAGSEFKGTYTVEVVKNTIKTVQDGSFVAAFEGTAVAKDTTRPTYKGLTYNAAGDKAYLEFSEPVVIDGDLSLTSVRRADGVALNSATTVGFTAADFGPHATKRNVVEVSLTDIDAADANKAINVNFVGLKDGAGNLVTPNPVSVTLTKDTAVKAQASITSVKRTSVNTLEVSFDKEIKTAPTAVTIGGVPSGAITATNDSKVYEVALNAAATPNQTTLTGLQNVTVTGWDAYNTAGAVSSPVTKIVDFTIERVAPTITSTSLTKIGGVDYLLVNLSEEVAIADLAAGTFTGTVSKPNGDLDVIPTVNFAAPTAHNVSLTATKAKTVKINLATLTTAGPTPYTFAPGTYNLEISAGVAQDSFGNLTPKKAASFTVSTSTLKLAAPTSVVSKVNAPSTVVVTFADKVDVATAQTASNYSIEGATVTGARVVSNTALNGATVELTIAADSINHEGVRQVTVKNVKGYADSFATMNDFSDILSFDENVAPKLASSTAVKLTATNKIVVDFDENLVDGAGTDFDVYQNGVKVASASALDTDTSKVVITLTNPVASTSGLVVKAASTIDLKDANHNGVVFTDTSVSN